MILRNVRTPLCQGDFDLADALQISLPAMTQWPKDGISHPGMAGVN